MKQRNLYRKQQQKQNPKIIQNNFSSPYPYPFALNSSFFIIQMDFPVPSSLINLSIKFN